MDDTPVHHIKLAMTTENEPQPRSPSDSWRREDLAFATSELSREFPNAASERVTSAMASAAAHLPATDGRVKLLQSARRFMRLP